jgi:hypothetical protein
VAVHAINVNASLQQFTHTIRKGSQAIRYRKVLSSVMADFSLLAQVTAARHAGGVNALVGRKPSTAGQKKAAASRAKAKKRGSYSYAAARHTLLILIPRLSGVVTSLVWEYHIDYDAENPFSRKLSFWYLQNTDLFRRAARLFHHLSLTCRARR